MRLNFGSVCSGIEAASQAWEPLGWKPAFLSEIEDAPRAVLRHYHPSVPLFGDFTAIRNRHLRRLNVPAIDVLVGGTPCQSFSVAGKRLGLDDPRGNLALEFLRLATRTRPRWLVWENVPGLLSSWSDDPENRENRHFGHAGNGEFVQRNDFATFLAFMGECGYSCAWRVLDGQHFGVPQRRRRVFVVGYLGDWRYPAAVLFEPEGLRGDITPRRTAGKTAPTIPSRNSAGGGLGTDFDCDGGLIPYAPDVAACLETTLHDYSRADGFNMVGQPLAFDSKASGMNGFGVGEISPTLTAMTKKHSRGNGGGQVAVAFDTTQITSAANRSNPQPGDPCHPLAAGAHAPALAFQPRFARNGRGAPDELASPLTAQAGQTGKGDSAQCVGARRLTPRECERLMGMEDDYTFVPFGKKMMPDGLRYKMLGNSMIVPKMRWIGERIDLMETLIQEGRA